MMLSEDEEEAPSRANDQQDHAALFVSLFMVVLSFFILLNTMSTYEEQKVRDVAEAVKQRFAYVKPLQEPVKDPISEPSGSVKERFFEAIAEHASRFIPVGEVNIRRDGDMIDVKVPIPIVFTGEQLRLNPRNVNVLEGFLEAYKEASPTLDIRLAVSVDATLEQSPGFVQQSVPQDRIQRSGLVARFFAGGGMATSDMRAGLTQFNDNIVRFRFHARRYEAGADSQQTDREEQP